MGYSGLARNQCRQFVDKSVPGNEYAPDLSRSVTLDGNSESGTICHQEVPLEIKQHKASSRKYLALSTKGNANNGKVANPS